MSTHPLDNPVWHSLGNGHADIALRNGNAARYPPQFAPFLAVGAADEQASQQLASLVEAGESVYLVGLAPPWPPGWTIKYQASIVQMVCHARLEKPPGPDIITLSAAHREDMMALTGLVYPGYFRTRTMEMGQYLGIYREGVLAAMAGERMRLDGYREISAVCTHPRFQGHGYARQLLVELVNTIFEQGDIPFLHTEHDNHRALQLYQRLGFSQRADMPIWSIVAHADSGNESA